jgi:hypothetical protein
MPWVIECEGPDTIDGELRDIDAKPGAMTATKARARAGSKRATGLAVPGLLHHPIWYQGITRQGKNPSLRFLGSKHTEKGHSFIEARRFTGFLEGDVGSHPGKGPNP